MKKRTISMVLAILLALSLLPGAAFAQGGADGTVRVVAENRTFTAPVDGATPAWTGTAFDETVAWTQDMTMLDALEAAAQQAATALTVTDGGYGAYLTAVGGLAAGDYPRKTGDWNMSGWMGSLNDWFQSTSLSDTAVVAGDTVRLEYSCDGGPDLGADWSNTDAGLRALTFSVGTLEPVFSPDVTAYTLTVPYGTQSVAVTPAAANRNDQAFVLADGETAARWGTRTMAAADGDTLTVSVAHTDYTGAQTRTNYTVRVRRAQPAHLCADYGDLKTDWSRAGICYVIDHGLMNGTAAGAFSPNGVMRRAMLVTVLWRAAGAKMAGAADFTDVAANQYYTGAVAWAAENGIVCGFGDGTFRPDAPVTRAQMATILHRYAAYAGLDRSAEQELTAFADAGAVPAYAADAMRWAVGGGLLQGVSATALAPAGTATRAQTAVVLWRLLDTADGTAGAVKRTARYLLGKNPALDYGGEWLALDLARSGEALPPAYLTDYTARVTAHVRTAQGALSQRYYTEYARVALALTAAGANPADVAGYDLTAPLQNADAVLEQGVNGAIYALLALDCGSTASDARQAYVDAILATQMENGGFTYTDGDPADPDLTAMALQALAPYRTRAAVAAAVERALGCLSALQQADGGFVSWGASASESSAQVLVALAALGVELRDARFVKDGHSLLDHLLSFRLADGSFRHTADGASNAMATEQAFRALVAVLRMERGERPLYAMR